ncbi:MAG: EAL domain-containing protein [Sporomusaceae bacterium]|nr:EAL domain-containing protein [Sporomusaceae bacterium]
MAFNLQLSGDHIRRIIEVIDGISGYPITICNEQGAIIDSTERVKVNKNNSSCHHYEKSICADGKVIGKVIIGGAGPIAELLATLVSEFFSILVEQHFSKADIQSLIHEYETIFNFVPAQIWYKDTKNRFIRVNKQVERDIGISVTGFAGCSAEELFPAYADQYYRDDLEVITSRKPKLGIIQKINTSNGEMRWLSTNKVPTFHADGSVSGLIDLVLDVTENIRIEEQRSVWATIFESCGEPMSVTDANNKFVAVNRAFSDATGYSLEEVIGKDPSMLKSGHHDETYYQNMWAAINQAGVWQGEIWEKRKDGTLYIKWLKIHQVKDSQGKLINYVATFSDITERKEAAARIAYLDRHDALTGLPNRLVLGELLDVAIQNAGLKNNYVGVISIDLDRFKNINDSLGHNIGDEFLKVIARRLESFTDDESVTGRFGGDTFIIILPNIHTKDEIIAAIGKRIAVIAESVMYDEVELMVTASMGVSVFPDDGDTAEVLIRNADTAMHKVKDDGRNSYQFFTAGMNEYASERLTLENGLRRAVERNEFVLFYQPQLNTVTGQVIGAEALIRWLHPTKKMVSPLDFIPLAEESGLIIPIGEWVLMEACRQHRHWIKLGLPPIPVSINISSVQFHDKGFLQMLEGVIKESGIEPGYLDLEVTESVVMRDPEFVSQQLQRIKDMGIKLSLDDFGTGFSSLSYLRHFPLDRLKIDQSFVRDLTAVPVNQAIIESVIALGRNLKIKTIAEGVETKEEFEFMQKFQCDEVQGYYFSKPLSSHDFINWMKKGETKSLY